MSWLLLPPCQCRPDLTESQRGWRGFPVCLMRAILASSPYLKRERASVGFLSTALMICKHKVIPVIPRKSPRSACLPAAGIKQRTTWHTPICIYIQAQHGFTPTIACIQPQKTCQMHIYRETYKRYRATFAPNCNIYIYIYTHISNLDNEPSTYIRLESRLQLSLV